MSGIATVCDRIPDSFSKGLRITARIQHIYYKNFLFCRRLVDTVHQPIVFMDKDTPVVVTT